MSLRIAFSCPIVTSSLLYSGVRGGGAAIVARRTRRRRVTSSCLPGITQAWIRRSIVVGSLLSSTCVAVDSACSSWELYWLCPAEGWCWLCPSPASLLSVTIGSSIVRRRFVGLSLSLISNLGSVSVLLGLGLS